MHIYPSDISVVFVRVKFGPVALLSLSYFH